MPAETTVVFIYGYLFVLPVLAGSLLRLACRRFRRGWVLTAVWALCAAAMWLVSLFPPIRGNEQYALRAVQLTCAAAGSLLTGLVCRKRKEKNRP